jgi:phage FluMu protein Com
VCASEAAASEGRAPIAQVQQYIRHKCKQVKQVNHAQVQASKASKAGTNLSKYSNSNASKAGICLRK